MQVQFHKNCGKKFFCGLVHKMTISQFLKYANRGLQ